MPFSPPFPLDDRAPDDFRPADELRGDLAADDFAVLDDEPDLAALEPPPLPLLPAVDVFDRAVVVLRDEDDPELPLFEDPLLELPLLRLPVDDALPLLRAAALFCAELPLRLDELVLLRPPPVEAFPPLRPAVFFFALLPVRLDEELLLRPPLELFLVDEELPDERLLLVAAAPFFPAALFCAELPLRDDVLRDDELLLRDEEVPPDELLRLVAAAAFFPAALFGPVDPPRDEDERELDPEDLEPPDEDRDDEDELFFEPPPLLLELDDEREPLDFLVVAMQIIPPMFWCVPAHGAICNIRAPIIVYQLKTLNSQFGSDISINLIYDVEHPIDEDQSAESTSDTNAPRRTLR